MGTIITAAHILLLRGKLSSTSNNLIENVLIQRHAVPMAINDENLSGSDSHSKFA